MPSAAAGLSLKSLAEMALLTSRLGREIRNGQLAPPPDSLREFWRHTRELSRNWMRQLDDWSADPDPEISQLGEIAAQLFVTEMLTRVWSTVLLGLDRTTGRDDFTRIARNAASGLLQVRHGVMSRLLQHPDPMSPQVAEIERLRRRCDRWTDLLIGNLCGRDEWFEFSFDLERARDFATESLEFDPSTGPHPVEHLVAAGLRMAFLSQLGEASLSDPHLAGLVESILVGLPARAFHRDGTIRSTLERRLSADTLRDEPLPASFVEGLSLDELSGQESEIWPFPGISFSKLRRRPK